MADKPHNTTGVVADVPGLPYYEKSRQHLKELLQRRRQLERQLHTREESILQKETDYLDNTPSGNIIAGFDNYTKGTTGTAAARRKTGITESNRVFSRSSISYNTAAGNSGSSSSHPPTPLQTSFKDGGISSGPGSGQATPTSASAAKAPHGIKKKKGLTATAAAAADDSETDTPMVLKATKFTPEVLLSAPRRSAGAPNSTGKKVLYTVSTYSFREHRKASQIRVLDVKSGESTVLYEDPAYTEPVWIGSDEFLFLKAGDKGTTHLLLGDASRPGSPPTGIRTFDGGLSNLKVLPLSDGAIAIALTGLSDKTGLLFNPDSDAEKGKPTHTTARVYSKLFVRHWDAYVTENRQTVWYGRLERTGENSAKTSGRYSLVSNGQANGLTNALAGTKLQSPVPPFGGSSDFALGPHGIAFVSRDPAYNEAIYTVSNLYFIPIKTYAEPKPLAPPYAVKTGALAGYSAGPVFSPSGNSLVFSRMRSHQYESDKPRLLLVPEIEKLGADIIGKSDEFEFYETEDGVGAWDARPDAVAWSADGAELFVTAEHHGRNALYRLPSDPRHTTSFGAPQLLVGGHEVFEDEKIDASHDDSGSGVTGDESVGFRRLGGHGSVSDVRLLASGIDGDTRLFLSLNSLVDNSFFCILDPEPTAVSTSKFPRTILQAVSSQSRHGSAFGLSPKQVGEIWYKGAGNYQVQALVVRPSDFGAEKNKNRKWPLALLIHGGPQGAWNNSWSTRWNPAVFAEQGYVVVAPNPTGSTGYGMALQDGIRNQWGGLPYKDIVRAVDYVEAVFPYVDISRAVALGASYGGYMMNWIQGQPLGRRFKALVNHDGVFSTLNQYSSEELFFPLHDFGGSLWDNRAGYERWDPAKFTDNWATPTLWVLKPENSLVWHKEVLTWINKYVGVGDEFEKKANAANLVGNMANLDLPQVERE
ncbi:oligopeptidase family protein [Grosmannia clavigera kw1407]|uniref:Chromatin modification-related protein EAF6 n=1 Tax=Grosmannia clavigera (strain kw1407 / UAMH 11150) TaxID=655863 RepID=F0XHH5_GROCL|nr:oligopeptidase family protein [Grosmannia clavigera kw1407]EFX03014.1 oligopeptidase family protein [Grosmannia clavigera kw1407]